MLTAPSIVCRVLRPMLYPIVAERHTILSVWPGHPTMTLSVLSPDCEQLLRFRHHPEGLLYGDLLNLYLDAMIQCVSLESERALLRSA